MRRMCLALAGLAGLAALPAAADPVYDMCMKPGQLGHEQCDCVTDGLQQTVSAADYALYSAVAARYLERLAEGMVRADAWDAAVQSEALARQANFAALLGTTNAVGKTQRDISNRCGG